MVWAFIVRNHLNSDIKERNTMRKRYEEIIKKEFRISLIQARNSKGLTQEQMAQELDMSVRAYCDLERGESNCGAVTFAIFLNHICEDPQNFLDILRKASELDDSDTPKLVS